MNTNLTISTTQIDELKDRVYDTESALDDHESRFEDCVNRYDFDQASDNFENRLAEIEGQDLDAICRDIIRGFDFKVTIE